MSKPKSLFLIFLLMIIFVSSSVAYSPQFADDENKVRLSWKNKKIPISISTSLFDKSNNIKTNTSVTEAINNSLERWESIADIEFEVSISDKNGISEKETSGDGVSLITIAPTSENILLFDRDIDDVSAITRLFYTKKGDIKEADIVLNPILLFSDDGTFRSFDLEATLTHEIGHLLGLGHSLVYGSTMHKHQGQNGVYNLPNYSPRTLSEDDKSGAISLYGKKYNDEECCGSIVGNLNYQNLKFTNRFHVWIEEVETGIVYAGIETDINGNFDFSGLPRNKFNLFAQDLDNAATVISLGQVDLTNNSRKTINKELIYREADFELQFLGYNGQLSNLAVPVQAGKSFTIYVAGENLNSTDFMISFNSRYFTVTEKSLLEHEYEDDLSVVSFEVSVSEEAKIGNYSVYISSKNGLSNSLVGGLTLDGIEK